MWPLLQRLIRQARITRIGNRRFAAGFNARHAGSCFRYVNHQDIVVYALFVIILWFRPQGLMGKM